MNTINIEEVVIVNSAGVLILVLSLLFRMGNTEEKHFDDHVFRLMIGITLGALVAETLTFLVDGRPGTLVRCMQYLLNAYLFLASCSVGTLWVLYVDYRIYHSLKRIQRRMIWVAAPLVLVAVLIVCDLFGAGLIFSVSEENVYCRGRLMVLPCLVLFYEYGTSLILAIFAVKRNNHVRFFPILYFVLPCVVGTVIQGLCYGLSVGWFCVALAFTFVQMQLNNQNAFVDDLSGLYNRKYYYHVIGKLLGSKKNQTIYGIMMDVNDFKSINDRFGHSAGDDAIRSLGKLISEVTTEQVIAFRHAGDEFIIIGTAEDETYVEQLIDALTQRTEHFNDTAGRPYQLSLASGYTLCNTAQLDSNSFLHQMDLKMYEAKNAYYSQEGKERRKGSRRDT